MTLRPTFCLRNFFPEFSSPPGNPLRFLSWKLGCQLFVERYTFALSIVFTVHVTRLAAVAKIYAPYVPEIGDYTTNVSRSLHRIFALKGAPRVSSNSVMHRINVRWSYHQRNSWIGLKRIAKRAASRMHYPCHGYPLENLLAVSRRGFAEILPRSDFHIRSDEKNRPDSRDRNSREIFLPIRCLPRGGLINSFVFRFLSIVTTLSGIFVSCSLCRYWKILIFVNWVS